MSENTLFDYMIVIGSLVLFVFILIILADGNHTSAPPPKTYCGAYTC